METPDIRGCGTALVTPFRRDESIDEQALRAFVQFQMDEGIDFLVPCGTTGESVTLSEEEQTRVVRIVLETSAGRVPVVAGAGGNNTARVIDKVRTYEALGVDAILSVSPYYNKPTQEGLFQHFRAIAQSTRLPIVVYNVPGRTAVNILPDTIVRLAAIPNIIGVKEASGDISQIGEIVARAPEGFKVFSGDDSLTLPVIALGGAGLISVASNEAPQLMTKFTDAALRGRLDEAQELHRRLFALMKGNFIETSPGPVKAALAMMGKIEEVFRLPLVPVQPATREKIRAILTELSLLPVEAVH
jgi:4-hydroxy-tetrahydrodipicolinate synthase